MKTSCSNRSGYSSMSVTMVTAGNVKKNSIMTSQYGVEHKQSAHGTDKHD